MEEIKRFKFTYDNSLYEIEYIFYKYQRLKYSYAGKSYPFYTQVQVYRKGILEDKADVVTHYKDTYNVYKGMLEVLKKVRKPYNKKEIQEINKTIVKEWREENK